MYQVYLRVVYNSLFSSDEKCSVAKGIIFFILLFQRHKTKLDQLHIERTINSAEK